MRQVDIKNEKETRDFGLELAEKLKAGDVVALMGDLGTGKTTLTGYIAEGLGVKEQITSPTFTIVKEYRSGRLPLFHFDVYRLGDSSQLEDTGALEYFDAGGVCVIEWADMVADILPEDAICVFMEQGEGEEERIYRCTC